MKVGIYGGSFDPVHLVHLWIAESAREYLLLDEVWWNPASQSPLKEFSPIASNEQRSMMIRLAIAGAPNHSVDERELRRGNVSYTIDTIKEITTEKPHNEYFLIVGGDSLASMPDWFKPKELLDLVTLAVVVRGGQERPEYSVLEGIVNDEVLERIRSAEVKVPAIEISSSEVRDKLSKGCSVRYRIPSAVEAYIRSEDLYSVRT